MKAMAWLQARRRRKAHERYLAEKARQDALYGRDAEEDVRNAATRSAVAQQSMYGAHT